MRPGHTLERFGPEGLVHDAWMARRAWRAVPYHSDRKRQRPSARKRQRPDRAQADDGSIAGHAVARPDLISCARYRSTAKHRTLYPSPVSLAGHSEDLEGRSEARPMHGASWSSDGLSRSGPYHPVGSNSVPREEHNDAPGHPYHGPYQTTRHRHPIETCSHNATASWNASATAQGGTCASFPAEDELIQRLQTLLFMARGDRPHPREMTISRLLFLFGLWW